MAPGAVRIQSGGIDFGSARIRRMGDIIAGDKIVGERGEALAAGASPPMLPEPASPGQRPPDARVQTGGISLGNASIGAMGDVISGDKHVGGGLSAIPDTPPVSAATAEALRRQVEALARELEAINEQLLATIDPATQRRLRRAFDLKSRELASVEDRLRS